MLFSSPYWLLLTIPWLGLLLYLMLGKPPRESVPFLRLWRGPAARRSVKPSISKLPLWIALLMLAALLAILAAAGPGLIGRETPAVSRSKLGIAAAQVRGDQLMVRILNETSTPEAPLQLRWPNGGRTETLQLPPNGERAYFLDLPPDLKQLRVSIGQHSVDLNRQRSWPRIEARTPIPESARRMMSAYTQSHAPGDDSAVIAVATDEPSLAGQPGVVLADAGSPAGGRVVVIDHPVTRIVDWPAVLAEARLASVPPGFTPVVRVDDRPAVAVRDTPRQVWIGFSTPGFDSRAEYVVLWTNVFDFTGEGVDTWQAAPGTAYAAPSRPVVQNRVQNVAPWFAVAAISITLLAFAVPRRRHQLG